VCVSVSVPEIVTIKRVCCVCLSVRGCVMCVCVCVCVVCVCVLVCWYPSFLFAKNSTVRRYEVWGDVIFALQLHSRQRNGQLPFSRQCAKQSLIQCARSHQFVIQSVSDLSIYQSACTLIIATELTRAGEFEEYSYWFSPLEWTK